MRNLTELGFCIVTLKVCDVGKSFEPIELLPHIKKARMITDSQVVLKAK